MKKFLSFLLVLVTVMGLLAGCRMSGTEQTDGTENVAENALEILQKVWSQFSDEEKFPVYGGDAANMTDGAPGEFAVSDTEGLQYNLIVPESQLTNIQQAASMTHGMMVNNFTCGVFRLKDGADANTFADAMRNAFQANQWLCGQPESLLIAEVDDRYVLAAFGLDDVLTTVRNKLAAAYPNAQVKYQEAIG